jgi:2-phosphosulfolactate phosphatase
MKIEILQLVEGAKKARGLTVIIDVFRAFTTEAFLMARGPEKLIPVGDVQTALDYKATYPNTILCGERGGAIIDGFDFGNSPSAVEKVDFTGKHVVHTTSAGTQGIVNATGAEEILGGCLVGAKAIACYIKKKKPEHVSLVCMGLAGVDPTDEDTLCAEYIKSLLEDQPLEDLAKRIEALKSTDGAKFFDPAQQSVFPQRDFELATMVDICPFVLRLTRDPESGLPCMERVDVPEAFSVQPGAMMSQFTREQVTFFPDWLKGRIVYDHYTAPEGNFDAAIVLGGANFLMESRARAAAELYHAGRCKLFIPTGGVKWNSIYGYLTEAEILTKHLIDLGVPADQIIPETKAATTRENFQFCKPILNELLGARHRRVVTVSSYGHTRRALMLAQAYLPEHTHAVYRASVSTDTPERFSESPEMRKRAIKECRNMWSYVNWRLIPDFPIL